MSKKIFNSKQFHENYSSNIKIIDFITIIKNQIDKYFGEI